jgi:hypothetical protein
MRVSVDRLRQLLLQRQAAVAQRWLEKTLATYPAEALGFLTNRQDPFANPVGHCLRAGLPGLLGAWLAGAAERDLATALEPIVRVRSVQAFTSAQAVSFVFLLKIAVREELGTAWDAPELSSEAREVDAQIDQLALVAFDVYTKCRDLMHQLRVDEVKRRVSGLMRRVGWGDEPAPAAPPVEPE